MRKWTAESERYLKAVYKTLSDEQIQLKLRHKFNLNFTTGSIKAKREKLKLLRGRIYAPKIYTEEVVEFIKQNYKEHDNIELANLINKRFNLNLTNNAIQMFKTNYKRRYGINLSSGINKGCIKKGNIPWNKGTKGICKPNSGCFKKGNISANNVPIGTERKNKNGYIEIKVRDACGNKNWELKQRYLYEKQFGKIPSKHKVIFADGNIYNFEIDNLILVSNGEELKMNQYGLRGKNKEITKAGANLAKYICKIGKLKNEKDRL